MTDTLYMLWRARVVLQLLAAFTGRDAFADIAASLDGIAALVWKLRGRP